MATKTSNLNLTKPSLTDKFNIDTFNQNMDIIDNIEPSMQDYIQQYVSDAISKALDTSSNIVNFTATPEGDRTLDYVCTYNKLTGLVVINWGCVYSSGNGNAASTHVNQFTIPSKYAPAQTTYVGCYAYNSSSAPPAYAVQARMDSSGVCATYTKEAYRATRGTFVYYIKPGIN